MNAHVCTMRLVLNNKKNEAIYQTLKLLLKAFKWSLMEVHVAACT